MGQLRRALAVSPVHQSTRPLASSQTTRAARREKRRKERLKAKRQDAGAQNGDAPAAKGKPKGKVREWLDALVFAFVVMLIVRTLFFDLFQIPTPSMEKNLLVGDYLFVSKLHYGTRLPMGICVPFTDKCIPGIKFPYTRLPGFSEVERFDAVVFNWPVDDLPQYDREVQQGLEEPDFDELVDRKTHYIKRVIGMPGETVEIRDKVVYADGEVLPLLEGMQYNWKVTKESPMVQFSRARLDALDAEQLAFQEHYPESGLKDVEPQAYPELALVRGTEAAAEQLKELPYVTDVEPAVAAPSLGYSYMLYPHDRENTPDNYGPVTIPAAGTTVELTEENWPVYEPVIRRYEGHTTNRVAEGTYEIDGQPAASYTFEQDYYWVMGDNRDNSEDSRFWGFVPMDHVVGKAILIYFSKEPGSFLVPRFERLFKVIR